LPFFGFATVMAVVLGSRETPALRVKVSGIELSQCEGEMHDEDVATAFFELLCQQWR
jgi:hypothetical protein